MLLSRILLFWEPLTLALTVSPLLPTLSFRGPLVIVALAARLAVAGLSVAAGMALWNLRPHGPALARAALIASAAAGAVLLNTRVLPSNRMPGDDLLYTAALVAHHGGWLLYLRRSPQVARLFG
jgi:hypothetical protein